MAMVTAWLTEVIQSSHSRAAALAVDSAAAKLMQNAENISEYLLLRHQGLLSFTSAHTDAWRQQGYEDTMLAMEHIRKPLAARQALTRSEAVLQKSLDITEEADLALRNAMARIK